MTKEQSPIKRSILIRVRFLYTMFIITGLCIVGKILYIQIGPKGDELRKKGDKITYVRVALEAHRGDILAVDGRLLSTSLPTYEIRMDFAANGLKDSTFYKHVDSLAYCLSSMFKDRSKQEYLAMLKRNFAAKSKNRDVRISPRRVSYYEMKRIKEFPIFRMGQNRGGIKITQVIHRLRPNGSLAGRTIGMTNVNGMRVGIEGAFNEQLAGVEGNVLMQKVSGQFRVPVADDQNIAPKDGMDVTTTIDIEIQDVAENALKQQLELADAQWGTVVLMEVATGEIRAIVNMTRKPNGKIVEDFNYAIGMNLEPGSTFKLATLIALLEDGKMSLDHRIDLLGGDTWIGKAHVVDSHKSKGTRSLKEIFAESSNVGFALAVNQKYASKPEAFVDFISKMGMDKPLDLQISGEAAPVIRRPGEKWWDKTTLTMMSYGYALRLTPLKTLSLYNAVANNGRMMRPLLVKNISKYSNVVTEYKPEAIVEEICSPDVLALAKECLESVVDDGTAKGLKSPYYGVAAKTGTAQIAQGRRGYRDSQGRRHYLGTLVGYFPTESPKYSCIVAIKTTEGKIYYGGSLAGPVFKAIADRVYASSTDWHKTVEQQLGVKSQERPPIKGGKSSAINSLSKRFKEHVTPASGQWVSILTDSMGVETGEVVVGQDIVPNVVGMGLRDAIYLLEKSGLRVSFSGKGSVVSQSVPAGTKVVKGELIRIDLKVKQI